jgi:HEAT repeat protein
MLALLGDDTGLKTLIAAVSAQQEWDPGWNYRGMGQFGNALSPLDTLIVAAGRAGNAEALPAILEKLKTLKPSDDFSHHRACALALELIGDPSAAKPLAELLRQEGMMGHVTDTVEKARQSDQESPGGTNAVQTRRDSLCELLLARALYRCGDYEGLGEQILRAYTGDLRGHLARHAKAVLDAGKP